MSQMNVQKSVTYFIALLFPTFDNIYTIVPMLLMSCSPLSLCTSQNLRYMLYFGSSWTMTLSLRQKIVYESSVSKLWFFLYLNITCY